MSLDVLDWRRRVFALYREVRESADPEAAFDRWCAVRQEMVTDHPASPNPKSVLRHADYDAGLRFDVEVDDDLEPARLEVETGTDGLVKFERIGRVALDGLGSLDVWSLSSYGGGVWLPVRDTSRETYGGGRYVLDTVKGADLGGDPGRLVVDLNFAYNPSCAYAAHWACPLAPPGNILEVELPVGEFTPRLV
jgi:hypothetical protein